MATLACGPRGETSEFGTLGARGELNAPAWPRASQFEELAPRARRHTHRCRKHLANTRSISYRPPIPHGQCWREIRLVLPRRDLLRRANFESRGEGVFVNCFRVPSHVPPPAAICERTARFCRQGFRRNQCGSDDDDGHGDDNDCQLRPARQSRHVRRAPQVRLCQMQRVRDVNQVRHVRPVAKWARPPFLMPPQERRRLRLDSPPTVPIQSPSSPQTVPNGNLHSPRSFLIFKGNREALTSL